MRKIALYLSLCAFIYTSCVFLNAEPEKIPSEDFQIRKNPPKEIRVFSVPKLNTFHIPLQTNGTIVAKETSLIKSKTFGEIKELPIDEGSFVKANQHIISVEDNPFQLKLQQLENDLQEAILKKNELLIKFDGEVGVDSSVSPIILNTINIKSGYHRILQSIKQAKYEISQTQIKTPFNGIISDLKVKQYQIINVGEDICNLINPYSFEVAFFLMESEALKVKIGQHVKVIPTAIQDMNLKAKISRVNPVVNEQGLIKFYAKLLGKERLKLFEGMNVRVFLENQIPNQLVIPKEALVLRSGKEVIFTYDEEENRAKWNYVKIAFENDQDIAISEGLKVGDQVIIEGNNNLAHDAEVALVSQENAKLETQQ